VTDPVTRGPLILRVRRPTYIQQDPVSNILVRTTFVAHPPFFLLDHPNPVRKNPDLWAHTFTSAAISWHQLTALFDWPTPPRKIYNQQDASGPNVLPIGIPMPSTIYARPPLILKLTRPIAQMPEHLRNQIVLGIPPPHAPFFLNDQPNPPRRPISYPDHNRPAAPNAGIPQPSAPLYLNDQPNPPRRPISYPDLNLPGSVLLLKLTPAPALFATDLINPPPGRARYQPDLIPNLLTSVFIKPPLNLPFSNIDFPIPYRKREINNYGIWSFGSLILSPSQFWGSINTSETPAWTPMGATVGAWNPISTAQTPSWGDVVKPAPPPIEGGNT